jgi:uncharacterized protein (TIGR03437 family)
MVSPAGIITTAAGDGNEGYALSGFGYSGDGGPATRAEVWAPRDLATDGLDNLYIAAAVPGCCGIAVRRVSLLNGIITTVAADSTFTGGIAVTQAGTLYVASWEVNLIYAFSPSGSLPGFSVVAPTAVAVDPGGNLYAVDEYGIDAVSSTGLTTLLAGGGSCGCLGDGGPAINAQFNAAGIAFDSAGNLYIADSENQRIRKVSSATGIITTIAGTGGPVISSVVSGASFQPGLVSNSWITILGTNLSSTTDTWANATVNGTLPTSLAGVSVDVNGQPAYIGYVSPNQINAVSPNFDFGLSPLPIASTISVTVTAPAGTSGVFSLPLQIYSPDYGVVYETLQPAFFLWPGGYAVATRQDFSWAVKNGTFAGTTTAPAKPSDVVILWGTGFGPTSPAAPAGVQVPPGTTYNTANPVTVTVGGKTAIVYGAALSPGYAGLYQIAFQIPPSLSNGDYPVIATINAAQFQFGGWIATPVSSLATVLITVQQ